MTPSPASNPPLIRPAAQADLPAINAIYNHYVLTSTCTYQTEPSTDAERLAWFRERGPKHPITVAERHGQIVGWGSLSHFHPRAAYQHTVEDSVYVRHDCHRQGLGRTLLLDLIAGADDLVAALSGQIQAVLGNLSVQRLFVELAAGHHLGFGITVQG